MATALAQEIEAAVLEQGSLTRAQIQEAWQLDDDAYARLRHELIHRDRVEAGHRSCRRSVASVYVRTYNDTVRSHGTSARDDEGMRIKIHGGTVRQAQRSLCTTCRFATVIKGHRLDEEIVECGQLSSDHSLVRFPVASCSGYVDRAHPSLREMEDAAWILRTDAKRKRIGFVQARELKPAERFVLPDDREWPL